MEAVNVALEVAVHKLVDKVDWQVHACETAQTAVSALSLLTLGELLSIQPP